MRAYRNSNYRNRASACILYLSASGIQSPLTGAGGTGQGRSTISIGTGQAFIYCRWHISLIQKGWEWILIHWLGLLVGPYSPHPLLGPSHLSLGLVVPASYSPVIACSVRYWC